MTLIEELRAKVSRDNRELLDRAADRIEELYRTLLTAYEKIEELERDRAGDGALEVCEYIKRSDVGALIKDFCKNIIEDGRDFVEVTEFNADIQKKLEGLPGVVPDGWISTEWELPTAQTGQVLALVNGKYKNIGFDHAVLLADYVDGEWMLEDYPEATDITVSHWAFIPKLPEGVLDEIKRRVDNEQREAD